VGKQQPPFITSVSVWFRGWRWCRPRTDGGGGGGKEQPPLKMSCVCSISRVEVVMCWQGATTLENEHTQLVFEDPSWQHQKVTRV
jgi:hypothetical protein